MGMAQYAVSFLLTSLVMSAIILAILLVGVLFPKAFPAKLRYAVWLVILVGLIFPLRPVIGSGLITVPLPVAAQTQYEAPADMPIESPPEAYSAQDTTDVKAMEIESTPAGWSISIVMVCVFVWGIVAAMIFFYHIWRYILFIKMIRRWGVTVEDENVLSVFRSVQAEKGLGDEKIGLKVCGFVSSSMLTGFWRPVILLPEKHFEADELELIFRHELIHYKRHDLLVKLLSVIAVSMHWYNPVVYWMCAATQTDGEASCDEAVLLDAGNENRQFYAEVIIGMIGGKNTSGTLLSTCFYGGKSSIKRRLDSIMDTPRKMKRPVVAVLGAVMALTVFSGSVFAFTAQEPPAAAAPLPITPPETTATDSGRIMAERANEIALATVGGGTVAECRFEDEREVYKVEVLYGDKRYSMDIDAVYGVVTNYRLEAIETYTTSPPEATNPSLSITNSAPATPRETPAAQPSSLNGEITAERAKEIALAKVGGGTVTECELDYENGRKVYEIKIIYRNTKYEMDVDASGGKISDYSSESVKGSSGSGKHHNDSEHGMMIK